MNDDSLTIPWPISISGLFTYLFIANLVTLAVTVAQATRDRQRKFLDPSPPTFPHPLPRTTQKQAQVCDSSLNIPHVLISHLIAVRVAKQTQKMKDDQIEADLKAAALKQAAKDGTIGHLTRSMSSRFAIIKRLSHCVRFKQLVHHLKPKKVM